VVGVYLLTAGICVGLVRRRVERIRIEAKTN